MPRSHIKPGEPRFTVTYIGETDPPEGCTKGSWFRYTIGQGTSKITGTRSGSLQSVSLYAEEFAEILNDREVHGYSKYITRKIQTK